MLRYLNKKFQWVCNAHIGKLNERIRVFRFIAKNGYWCFEFYSRTICNVNRRDVHTHAPNDGACDSFDSHGSLVAQAPIDTFEIPDRHGGDPHWFLGSECAVVSNMFSR